MVGHALDAFGPELKLARLPDGELVPPVGADFSECGRYRFKLWRIWDQELAPLGVIMLNPSTADASNDDPTIRRVINFARSNQFGGVMVGNLYALRSTDPSKLWRPFTDPVGIGNDSHLVKIAMLCPTVLCAWGANAERGRSLLVKETLKALARPPKIVHLGLTKDGLPRHPLYIASKTPFTEWA